jgi:hypothetical protein
MTKFKAGDTITNGQIFVTVQRVTRTSYQLHADNRGPDQYMPVALVDRLWTIANNEGEIIDE